MQLQVFGENRLEITQALQEHINAKAQLVKALSPSSKLEVRVKIDEKSQNHVKLNTHHEGHDYFIDHVGKGDMYSSVTQAMHKLQEKLNSVKKKLKH